MNKNQLQTKLIKVTKYSRWYLNIIENAQNQNRIKLSKLNEDYIYYENHHILPKSIFKNYSNLKEHTWNSILLTPKEHFVIHICIWKHYKSIQYTYGEIKMSRAIDMLSKFGKYNSKQYRYFKINLSHSEETKKKMSISGKGKNKGKVISIKQRNDQSEFMKNRIITKETRNNMSKAFKGRKHTDETKKKNSIFHKGLITVLDLRDLSRYKVHTQLRDSNDYLVSISTIPRIILDDKNNVTHVIKENLGLYLKHNNLPAKFNVMGEPLYINLNQRKLTQIKNNGNIKYKGWKCIKVKWNQIVQPLCNSYA